MNENFNYVDVIFTYLLAGDQLSSWYTYLTCCMPTEKPDQRPGICNYASAMMIQFTILNVHPGQCVEGERGKRGCNFRGWRDDGSRKDRYLFRQMKMQLCVIFFLIFPLAIKSGHVSVIFASPEALIQKEWRQTVGMLSKRIVAFGFDEAHCLVEW